MIEWLRLVRARNLLLAAAGVLAGGWIALAQIGGGRALALAALSGAALGAAGNTLNDLHDLTADRVNRGGTRPLAAGRIGRGAAEATVLAGILLGLAAAGLVDGRLVAVGVLALAVMAVYSPVLKQAGSPGNLAVATVAGLPLFYGALAVGRPAAGLVPWLIAGWIHLVRELVKDLEDEAGDRVAGRATLPVRIGAARTARLAAWIAVAFVPLSVALPLVARYRWPYFALAAVAQTVVLVVAWRLGRLQLPGASAALKAAMAVGLAALVAGRVA